MSKSIIKHKFWIAILITYLQFFVLLFPDIGQIKQEKNYEICEGCGQKIHDRYLMRVANTSWHEQCLSCSVCRIQLDQTCFTRNAKLYCKDDYYR